ncbi:MAG: GNAT family N-acetyltransferase [Deltaproteobacteria bacterium]|nr:GNAT family N-acetyltransferase [Deltaproteobacteria bacterium]
MDSKKRTTVEEALERIKKGSRIFIGCGCGEPQFLVKNLVAQADRMYDVEILHVLSARDPGYTASTLGGHFRVQTFFMASRGAREAVWEGRAEYTPIFISDIPRLFNDRRIEIDYALIQVSPPDKNGYMSLGVAVDVTKEAIEAAGTVIAQVNPAMPVTLGESFIHLDEVDALIEHEEPLLEVARPHFSETDLTVGRNIARLIEDGSTIHTGLGHLPAAALQCLKDKKDLGIHTDMLTDGYLDLIRSGAVTNREKEINRKKVIASYCLGTRELFDFVHLNSFVEFHPISYTNNPTVISQHQKMITIHEALEVDLTGLVCTSAHPDKVYSGIGGLIDFMRGTWQAKKGKFIIALRSTTRNGQCSCIVPTLPSGSGIIASRAAVGYVVTEFGSVNLHAKSFKDRALALIEIAHPKFRQEFLNLARDQGLLSHGEPITYLTQAIYPQELEKKIAFDSQTLLFRPAKPSDVRIIQEFFYSLSDRDIYYRFLRSMKAFPREEMAAMADIDYHFRMTILCLTGEVGFEKMIAIARYIAEPGKDLVEVDVAVAEGYRRMGIGKDLLEYICEIAKGKGFKGISAYVDADNPKTIHLLKKLGYNMRATLDHGVYEIEILFEEKSAEPSFVVTYA